MDSTDVARRLTREAEQLNARASALYRQLARLPYAGPAARRLQHENLLYLRRARAVAGDLRHVAGHIERVARQGGDQT